MRLSVLMKKLMDCQVYLRKKCNCKIIVLEEKISEGSKIVVFLKRKYIYEIISFQEKFV